MDSTASKILLVDDDELSQRMMGLLMSENGYNFDIASNGIEAFEAVQAHSYGIVLMDLQMPLMDGFEATSKIRNWEASGRHTPIVALTAMLFPDEIQKCLNSGMDDCIAKPFNAEMLFELIECYVNKSKKTTSAPFRQESSRKDELVILDIQDALPRFGKDIEIYREFLNEFIDGLPQRIGQFKVNFLSGDYMALAAGAHNLKGISASMGAKQLSALSHRLDKDSQEQNLLVIQRSLEEVEKHIGTFQREAIDILDGFTAK